MFRTPHVLMTLAKATLKRVTDEDGALSRQVEVALALDPFPQRLAVELGRAIAGHLYDGERVRSELEQVKLDPCVNMQCVAVSAGADGSVKLATLRQVEIGPIIVTRCEDEHAGTSWLKATIKARFDFAPKAHRDFIAAHFGDGLYWSFEDEQPGLLSEDAARLAPAPDPDAGDVLDAAQEKPRRDRKANGRDEARA